MADPARQNDAERDDKPEPTPDYAAEARVLYPLYELLRAEARRLRTERSRLESDPSL